MFTVIFFIVAAIVITAGYLCLPYAMWKAYASEWPGYHVIKLAVLLVFSIIWALLFGWNAIPFAAGYIVFDPFSYYFFTYKPRLAKENAKRNFYDRIGR